MLQHMVHVPPYMIVESSKSASADTKKGFLRVAAHFLRDARAGALPLDNLSANAKMIDIKFILTLLSPYHVQRFDTNREHYRTV